MREKERKIKTKRETKTEGEKDKMEKRGKGWLERKERLEGKAGKEKRNDDILEQ